MSTIEKRGINTYRLRVYYGSDSNGKKKFYDKSLDLTHIKPNKQMAEAEKQFILFKDEVEKGLHLDAGKITFGEFIKKWLQDYAEPNLAPKTLFSYRDMLEKRIIPALGHIKLNKLQPNHLLEFYNNLREGGIRLDKQYQAKEDFFEILAEKGLTTKQLVAISGISRQTISHLKTPANTSAIVVNKICSAVELSPDMLFEVVGHNSGLSGRTILYYHRIISSILTTAVQWQFILSNPAKRVKPPKVEKKEAPHFDLKQTEYIFSIINEEPLKYRVAVYLCIFGGLRTGELNALEWSDINWDDLSIGIDKASQYLPGQGTFTKSTKNLSSERVISLPEAMMSLLKEYKLWQNGMKAGMEDLWLDSNRLFTQYNGTPIFPSTIGSWFTKFLKRHNKIVMMDESISPSEKSKYLLDKVSFHGLRHTSATLLIGQNVDIATVSRRLGHANISTTLNIYTHALTKLDRTASDSLGNLFSDKKDTLLKHG